MVAALHCFNYPTVCVALRAFQLKLVSGAAIRSVCLGSRSSVLAEISYGDREAYTIVALICLRDPALQIVVWVPWEDANIVAAAGMTDQFR
jgi:hypothetical protein